MFFFFCHATLFVVTFYDFQPDPCCNFSLLFVVLPLAVLFLRKVSTVCNCTRDVLASAIRISVFFAAIFRGTAIFVMCTRGSCRSPCEAVACCRWLQGATFVMEQLSVAVLSRSPDRTIGPPWKLISTRALESGREVMARC